MSNPQKRQQPVCCSCGGARFVWQRRPHEGDEYPVPCQACSPLVVPPWFGELRDRLNRQDNAATADPLFIVQQRVREYGYDPYWASDFAWIREGDELDEEEAAVCEATHAETGADKINEADRTGYQDRFVFVTACLTRQAAEDYIEHMRHRLCDPRVYVETAYRNHELLRLRKWLMGEST